MPLQVFDDIEESETSFSTATVQVLNATELRLNGVNIDSRYVQIAGEQTITGLKTFNQIRLRNVRVKPLVTGTEASLLFWDNVDDNAASQTGDLWRLGLSIGANNRRSFVLAPDQVGAFAPMLKFTPAGVLSLNTGCVLDAPTIRQNNVSLNDLLAGKQNILTTGTSNTPILNGTVVRQLQASSNINLSTANDIITISADLSGYALASDVTANLAQKQDKLIASATGTFLLNGTVIRSLNAGTGIGLSTTNNTVTITANRLDLVGGLQEGLTPITTNVPIMVDRTIRALNAGTNVSLQTVDNIITINASHPNLSQYALTSDVIANLAQKQNNLLASATGTFLLNGDVIRSLVAGSNMSLSVADNAVTLASTPLPPTELTYLHQNFCLLGGGTVTLRTVSNNVYIRWGIRVSALPLCGKAGSTYYEITCPTTGTIGTGQTATADGILLGPITNSFAALYYVLPTGSASFASIPANFRLVTWTSTTENIQPNYVLLAQIATDSGQASVKWQAGSVVIPIPDNGQQITWNANAEQLGRGATKITLDGGTGTISAPAVTLNGTDLQARIDSARPAVNVCIASSGGVFATNSQVTVTSAFTAPNQYVLTFSPAYTGTRIAFATALNNTSSVVPLVATIGSWSTTSCTVFTFVGSGQGACAFNLLII